MNKLSQLIENLNEEDLKLIRKDLDSGNMERLINFKLQEKREADPNKACPVCHSPIREENLTLFFGPKGLRKRASFCALDCLEYFLNMIKEEKQKPER